MTKSFRIVRGRKMIESDVIDEIAMISKKEANQLRYSLVVNYFLQEHEIKKSTLPSQTNKNIYLYNVKMESVSKNI